MGGWDRPVSMTRAVQMELVAGVALDWTVINSQWVRGGEVSATADSFTGCLLNAVLVLSTRRVSVKI